MTITLSMESDTDQEQRLLMPGTYIWQEFEALEALLSESPGLRITYLDGLIEIMTLGEKKDNPDLAIEVILTSGGLQKLEKYKRFQIPEVWLWEDNQLKIYHLEDNTYQEFSHSQLLPELNIELLVYCVQIPSRLEAMKVFREGITP